MGGCSRRAIKSWPFRDKVKVGVGFMERRCREIRKAQEKELKDAWIGAVSPQEGRMCTDPRKDLGKTTLRIFLLQTRKAAESGWG